MAKFIYKMQGILNIKLKLEDQAKAEFSAANARLSEEEDKLAELTIRRRKYERQSRELMSGVIDPVALRENKHAIDVMKTMIKNQMVKVQVAQKNVELARKKLNGLMVERKAQETLKEKAFEEFKKELAAEEMKEIDGLVSYTYGSGKADR